MSTITWKVAAYGVTVIHTVEIFPSQSLIEEALAKLRTFAVTQAQDNADYQHACLYDTHFNDMFEQTQNQLGDVTNGEFATFFHVLQCFDEDSDIIKSDSSSALKASNFIVYFILPPFFPPVSPHFEFKQEKPWGFPIFLSTEYHPDPWCQFRLRSDFIVSSRLFLCPSLISEIVSQDDEADRYRMLLQAIPIARAGQYLIRYGSPMLFFVVAVYLRANLTTER
ncbi:hypothetical protein K503DRAFT_95642 [Rhizopogon vinicolor AM-OR11-026]|uniref:Uncharacterized protein n=1 Tax=Rhizopogon vinicolor AM-OR11-026 TaxID=1314800 RepID=A0A1B7MFF6_9AGAM|nr:hypothetical protein K503DRAFT_95642 [Rhizopogon vinicolor AM-OR11-026]